MKLQIISQISKKGRQIGRLEIKLASFYHFNLVKTNKMIMETI